MTKIIFRHPEIPSLRDYKHLLLFIILASTAASCSQTDRLREHRTLNATLWVQTAAEYDALCHQAYILAAERLDRNTVSNSEDKPLAIIADVDETVLDNSPFQARMIMKNSDYDPAAWDTWVKEAKAEAVPGALPFFRKAASMGIKVYYITNRDASNEEATRKNLMELGFPISDDEDRLLMKNEKAEWTSAKTDRRKKVLAENDVILYFGDDLNDFLPAKNISMEERDRIMRANANKFGREWFMLPNPNYGSWERALYDFRSDMSDKESHSARRKSLDPKKNE